MLPDRGQDAGRQHARGRGHRHGADDVRAAGFFAVRQVGPGDVGRGHDVDGAAAAILGRTGERRASADQRAGPERRIHLVGGERHEVQMLRIGRRAHGDGTMRGQLRGVDENPRPDGMRLPCEPMDRRDEPGDVRRAGDGQERHAPTVTREQAVDLGFVELPVGEDARAHDLGASPPRQVVRMMLHGRRQHDRIGRERVAEGQLVDRLGRVLPEDDGLGRRIGADEPGDRLVRVIPGGRADARFVARAPMDAGVEGQEALHRVQHLPQRRRRRRVVEVDVGRNAPIGLWNRRIQPDNVRPPVESRHHMWDRDNAR